MGQDDALGDAGRSARVDDRGFVVGPDGTGDFLEEPRLGRGDRPAPFPNPVHRQDAGRGGLGLENDDVLDLGETGPDRGDFLILEEVGDDDDFRVAVVDDVLDLLGDQGGIDRNRDAAQAEIGKIGDRPFGAILGENDQLAAPAVAEVHQSQGEFADGRLEFGRRDVGVNIVPLHLEKIGLGEAPNGM